MIEKVKIAVNNKPLSLRERAEDKGLLTIEEVERKITDLGYQSLMDFEKEIYKEMISIREKKSTQDITELDILNYCKESRVNLFKAVCEEKIIEGFTASNGHFYRTNRDDQTNMIGQKDELSDNIDEIVYWKSEDSGYIPHSREEWLRVYQEAFTHKKGILFRYDSIKKSAYSATTHQDLQNIVW